MASERPLRIRVSGRRRQSQDLETKPRTLDGGKSRDFQWLRTVKVSQHFLRVHLGLRLHCWRTVTYPFGVEV